jgi:N-acetylmuramoyl-L-alanine amidase
MNKLVLLCFLSLFVRANEITFDSIEQTGKKEITISFKLEKVSLIRSYSLENPSRIVVEVNQSELKNNIDVPYNYPIKKVRASQDGGLTRIVVDLYESVYWQNPSQVIDEENIYLKLPIKKNKNLNKNIRDIVVAIDAGHGGKYPGAVGPNNILEKDITLLIAKELQRTLDNTTGYRSVMIRAGDETIGLNDRYQNARKFGADIFISIHADGFRLSSVKGASVFIWSDEASSTVARNLSDKQRKRIQADIKNLKPMDFNEDVARALYPEMYKNKISESKTLGSKILDQLKRDPFTKIHKKNVEYADFRVLKSIDIPSVLVESGFITNPEDAQRLKGKPGRRMIARSIFLGIHNYFKEKPKANTFMHTDPGHVIYEIQKGDVLSEIAIRFGVTVDELNETNSLGNKSIYPGQLIKINI